MDKSKILYLITLETMGQISANDSSELLKAMQSEKDFPWKEMGEYQNLAALLSTVVNEESPAKNLKDRILNEIEKIEKGRQDFKVSPNSVIKNESVSAEGKEKPEEEDNLYDNKTEKADTEKEELKIVDHSSEFEEVKAKLFKIQDHQKKISEPGVQLNKEHAEEITLVKRPKQKKSKNKFIGKRFVLAASISFLVAAFSVIFYLNFYNSDIEEQKKIATRETEMLISKSKIVPKEQEPVLSFEKVDQVEPQINEQIQLKPEEEKINDPLVRPEIVGREKEEEMQKPDLPPMHTPDFIDAPLVLEEEQDDSEKVADPFKTASPEEQLPPKEEIITSEEPVYFVAVEEMPVPIGGISGIQKRIVYPEIAKRAGIEGKVLVLAFVDESGNVTKTEVIKGIGLGCDEAAIDAIVQTKFTPGKQRGKTVKVRVTIPVTFKL